MRSLRRGQLLLAQGEAEDAEDRFRALLKVAPGNTEATRLLVTSLVQSAEVGSGPGGKQAAAGEGARQRARRTTWRAARYTAGRVCQAAGRLEKALARPTRMRSSRCSICSIPMPGWTKLDRAWPTSGKHIKAVPRPRPRASRAGGLLSPDRRAGKGHRGLSASAKSYRRATREIYSRLTAVYLLAGRSTSPIATLEQGDGRSCRISWALQVLLAACTSRTGDYDKARTGLRGRCWQNKPDLKLAANNLATLLVDRFPATTT